MGGMVEYVLEPGGWPTSVIIIYSADVSVAAAAVLKCLRLIFSLSLTAGSRQHRLSVASQHEHNVAVATCLVIA